MTPDNIIAAAVVIAILGSAIAYILRARKKGIQCIGCPNGASCAGQKAGGCSQSSGANCSGSCANCSGCAHGKTHSR